MINTGRGDEGYTYLADGNRVVKSSQYCNACGTVDELISMLGLAKQDTAVVFLQNEIEQIQKDLQTVCTYLSCVGLQGQFDGTLLVQLNSKMMTLEKRITLPQGFILPGDTKTGAILDIARTICRRTERETVKIIKQKKDADTAVLRYLNKLSDYLFLLARYTEGNLK